MELAQVELTPWRLHHGERAPYHGACTIELAPLSLNHGACTGRACTMENVHHTMELAQVELAPWRLHLRACTIYDN